MVNRLIPAPRQAEGFNGLAARALEGALVAIAGFLAVVTLVATV